MTQHSFWKPIRNAVQDAPLAVCDARAVRPSDLVAVDIVKREYAGETAFALPSPNYKWYYLSHQRPDEVLLFKNFDSKKDCVARGKTIVFLLHVELIFISLSTWFFPAFASCRQSSAPREY
jgi:hypothetical protein